MSGHGFFRPELTVRRVENGWVAVVPPRPVDETWRDGGFTPFHSARGELSHREHVFLEKEALLEFLSGALDALGEDAT